MGKTYKRRGIWYIDTRIAGKRVRRRVSRDKKTAELYLHDLEVKAERGQLGFIDQKNVSIDAFLNQFLDYSKANHRPSTTSRYSSTVDHFRTFFVHTLKLNSLTELRQEHADQYKAFRRSMPVSRNGSPIEKVNPKSVRKGAKAYTLNFELTTLKTALNLAVKWGYLTTNPASGAKELKPEDSKPRRFLTESECERLLDYANAEMKPIFKTFLYTGMRRGELTNLEWADVDFKQRVIKIRRKAFWIPKTGEREIPMNTDLVLTLNKLPKNRQFVFADPGGSQLNAERVRRELIRAAQEAGIENLTELHAFRHTFASRLFERGVDAPTVQRLMGHTSIETTMIYTHQTANHLREAVEKVKILPAEHEATIKIG